jgi:hypothetical protein
VCVCVWRTLSLEAPPLVRRVGARNKA